MMNKKGKWEWDYNAQIIVDEYKGIILSSYITQNPTDHFELIPSIEQLKNNLTRIYDELPPPISNSVPIMDIQQMKTQHILKKKA